MRACGEGRASRRVAGLLVVAGLVGGQAPVPPSGTAPGMSPPDTWVPRQAAELVMLDKLRAQPSTITVRTGQTGTFGTLTIGVKGCAARPLDLPQNSTAYVEVTDGRGIVPPFKGWIFSGMPALGQYEHPIYGMRLLACR